MAYTPGEWKVEGDCYIIAGEEHKHSLIADIATANDDYEANAHLIAAAPAMYEALKKLTNAFTTTAIMAGLTNTTIDKVLDVGRKALTKAEERE